jgi:rhamnosyltransferase
MTNAKVVIIYLAYHPSEFDLVYVTDLAANTNVVVVSNSGPHDFGTKVLKERIFVDNVGVGAGYNAGLELAREVGATHVMFHDQDSRLDPSILERAVLRLGEIETEGAAVLSLNPIDIEAGTARTARLTKPVSEGDLLRYRDVQFSGMICRIEHFKGDAFSATLFVDFIDSEWCWRTRSALKIYRDEKLTIRHNLGSGTRKFLGLEYSLPAPIRYYFQTRNLVLLTGAAHVPKMWPLQTLIKFLLRGVVLPFIEPKFLECWKESWRGVVEGLTRRRNTGSSPTPRF